MIVITKNNIDKLPESVQYLVSIGFKKFNILFDYLVEWKDEDLEKMKKSFLAVSQIYYEQIMNENDIDFLVFDDKIRTYIKKDYNCNDDCNFGMKNTSVGTDGNFYPCMQFVGNEKFIIGNCADGINVEAHSNLMKNIKKENEICADCDIKTRCKHLCPCKNYLTTQDINGLSPVVCEFERVIIEIADGIAEKLYKNNSKLFIQKFYNEKYGIIKEIMKLQK